MYKLALICLSLSAFAQSAFSMECPKKIEVSAEGFSSIASTNTQKIEAIYKLGDKQTDKTYIQAVLSVANKLTDFAETLSLSKKYSTDSKCSYVGKASSLSIVPVENEWAQKGYTAVLKTGKINYQGAENGNPTAHKGLAVSAVSHLTKFSVNKITQPKKHSAVLSFDLFIQIPMGDYGTDGFEETAVIGSVESVIYRVVE